jgi:phospholipid-transporting ATPase
LLQRDLAGEERIAAHEFFLTLAACNTVIPVPLEDPFGGQTEAPLIEYQGESPDEQALVTAASAYGYTLVERTTGHIAIDVHGKRMRHVSI